MNEPPSSPPSRQAPADDSGASSLADPDDFAALFRSVYRRLTLVAAGVTGDRNAAEDIVQEAALVALAKIGQFTPGSSFGAWMAEIVRRCALNHRRKGRSRRTYATDPQALGEMVSREPTETGAWPVAAGSGELVADQAAFDDRLQAALYELSADARCCLLLRVVEQLSYAEIGQLMQIPEGTAMSHVHRSKQTLRRRLAPPSAVGHNLSPSP